ncbi:hypothetical protein HELRODRAFT_85515, partial [Helobdella robusta]|uniref:GPI mannosyltransferase 2 n=1 Tax=Helobdella robusta TaxID=6412 RepID=T1G5Y3_HELRO
LVLFFFQAVFNYMIPDHKADVFNPPHTTNISNTFVSVLFDGLTNRWDAIYFIHIAEHSYTFENTLVFFPLFPLIVKLLTFSLFYPFTFFLSIRNVLQIVAVLINFILFILSALTLYKFGLAVLKNEHLSYRAAQLFCVNPASIFFSAAYSESLFSLLTFAGLLKLQSNKVLHASILFGLSAATRSNGLVNMGFIVYYFLHFHLKAILKFDLSFCHNLLLFFIYIFLCCSWFIFYQLFAYIIYCEVNKSHFKNLITNELRNYGKEKGYFTLGDSPSPPWCKLTVPISYSSIQNSHWNLGFLKYYQVKQLPNFFLASPMLFICFYLVLTYFKNRFYRSVFLEMMPRCLIKKLTNDYELKSKYSLHDVTKKEILVHVCHIFFLTIFALFFMHIQVITRLICSSCPVVYWFLAQKSITQEEKIAIAMWKENINDDQFKNSSVFDVCGKDICKSTVENNHSRYRSTTTIIKKVKVNKQKLNSLHERTKVITDTLTESELINWNESLFNKFFSAYTHIYLFVGVAAFCNFFPWT